MAADHAARPLDRLWVRSRRSWLAGLERLALLGAGCLGILVSPGEGGAAEVPREPVSWPATDALGRGVPTPEAVGLPRTDRWVGIFYFLWHRHAEGKRPDGQGPYDVSLILAEDPDALKKADSPLWGRVGTYHYWAEPLYGYYLSTDPWVLRRHAMLLADAGVDTLIIDATNALTYPEEATALGEVLSQMRREGEATPQLAFMVNTEAGKTADKLYREIYEPGRFRDVWFRWEGKPLLLCDPNAASPTVKAFFTLRKAHWPFEMINTPYAWHWEATYPQPYGFTTDPNRPEQVNVSVAQNLREADGKVTNMSNGDARGRSFHQGGRDTSPGAVLWGRNFEEQWKRAYELAAPFVLVTGWNEWIAGRWGKPEGPLVFVDQYDQEHSRDIEPMRGGHGDNYYWQLVGHLRRYKGARPIPAASAPITIRLARGGEQWAAVQPAFSDHRGETQPRDHAGVVGLHYANRSGRHDLAVAKVARDRRSVFFYLQTRQPLPPASSLGGLWLLLDVDQNRATGWEGYDYVVNRSRTAEGKPVLERNVGGWAWAPVREVPWRVFGTELHLQIPRTALGLARGATAVAVDFKWVDNPQRPGELMDFYVSGDVAPEGRFNYRYVAP